MPVQSEMMKLWPPYFDTLAEKYILLYTESYLSRPWRKLLRVQSPRNIYPIDLKLTMCNSSLTFKHVVIEVQLFKRTHSPQFFRNWPCPGNKHNGAPSGHGKDNC